MGEGKGVSSRRCNLSEARLILDVRHLNLANVYEQKGSEYHVEARNQFERARKLAGRCLGKDSEEVKETQGSIERLDRIKYAAAYQLLTLQDRELDRMKAIANNTGYQRST